MKIMVFDTGAISQKESSAYLKDQRCRHSVSVRDDAQQLPVVHSRVMCGTTRRHVKERRRKMIISPRQHMLGGTMRVNSHEAMSWEAIMKFIFDEGPAVVRDWLLSPERNAAIKYPAKAFALVVLLLIVSQASKNKKLYVR